MDARLLAESLVPADTDLPGAGWIAISGELTRDASTGAGELLDCVGPDFPESSIVATAESSRYLRPPHQIVYGVAAVFDRGAAPLATSILLGSDFAICLAESVVEDLRASDGDTEVLESRIEPVTATGGNVVGNRASFAGAGAHGIISVILDIRVVSVGSGVAVVWFGDANSAFPSAEAESVLGRIEQRSSSIGPG